MAGSCDIHGRMLRHHWPDTAAFVAGCCGIAGRILRHPWPNVAALLAGCCGIRWPDVREYATGVCRNYRCVWMGIPMWFERDVN